MFATAFFDSLKMLQKVHGKAEKAKFFGFQERVNADKNSENKCSERRRRRKYHEMMTFTFRT